jgi:tetratricopeptide (TPR) repeat protein
VVARSSSFSFKGKNEDVRSVGEKLNVAHVLEGSVRKSGSRLRVTAQLVNAADGYQLWSQTFEREAGDIFAVQDEVARAVVNTLRVKSLPELRRSSSGRATSPEAYSAYLRGLQLARGGSSDELRKAIDEFRTAIQLDPNYAPAHASFAKSLLFYSFYATNNELFDAAWRRHSLDAAEKAVALDPKLPDAYVARAIARHDAWDWPGALSDLEEALALAPSNAEALSWRSVVLGNVGRATDALADARLAVSIDPLSAQAHYTLGYEHRSLGQYSDARASFERSRALAPGLADATLQLGYLELLTGNPSKALAIFETAPQEWAKLTGLALAQHSLGNNPASRQALAQLISKYSAAQYQIAEAYAWRGERDQALQWLERAYTDRDPGIAGILTEPFFWSLHDDPRFVALVAQMKLPPIK